MPAMPRLDLLACCLPVLTAEGLYIRSARVGPLDPGSSLPEVKPGVARPGHTCHRFPGERSERSCERSEIRDPGATRSKGTVTASDHDMRGMYRGADSKARALL